MKTSINFYSEIEGEIKKFFQKEYDNPVDMIDMISCFIDNNNKFKMTLWISLDKDVYICVTDNNLDNLIKYIYERYPY